MTREQILAWELSCNLRDQQQNALSPETDSVPPMCEEAGCPPGILWEFSQQWKIRYKSQHLSCFQILWVSVQFSCSVVSDFATPWNSARQASVSITNSRNPPKLTSIESVMPSNHLILCCPLLLSPSIFPNIRVFSNKSALHIRWPKYWSFSFNISPSEWEKIIANEATEKQLISKVYKQLLQLNSRKISLFFISVSLLLSHI